MCPSVLGKFGCYLPPVVINSLATIRALLAAYVIKEILYLFYPCVALHVVVVGVNNETSSFKM